MEKNNIISFFKIDQIEVNGEICIYPQRKVSEKLFMPVNLVSIRQTLTRYKRRSGRNFVSRIIDGNLYIQRILGDEENKPL